MSDKDSDFFDVLLSFYGFVFGGVTPYICKILSRQSSCILQEVLEEKQPPSPISSPSHSSSMKKFEELECVTDVSGRPSPVSVLETPFPEDNISPENTRFESGRHLCIVTLNFGNILKTIFKR